MLFSLHISLVQLGECTLYLQREPKTLKIKGVWFVVTRGGLLTLRPFHKVVFCFTIRAYFSRVCSCVNVEVVGKTVVLLNAFFFFFFFVKRTDAGEFFFFLFFF